MLNQGAQADQETSRNLNLCVTRMAYPKTYPILPLSDWNIYLY